MANTQSARKNVRQSRRRRARRRAYLVKIKVQIKNFLKEPTPENQRRLQRILDKSGRKGVIKKNKAQRLVSRFSRLAVLPERKNA